MTLVRVAHEGGRLRRELRTGAFAPRLLGAGATGARVALVATGAMVLSGDDVQVDVSVGAGCWLELVEVTGTVAHDVRGGAGARWDVRVDVAPGGLLLWGGEPVVVAGGADLARTTAVTLAGDAVACLRDTLVLGRAGEAPGRYRGTTAVHRDGRPLLVEDLDLRDPATAAAPGVLGGVRCVDTLAVYGARGPTGGDGAHLQLHGPGTIARSLVAEAHRSALGPLWATWSAALAAGHR